MGTFKEIILGLLGDLHLNRARKGQAFSIENVDQFADTQFLVRTVKDSKLTSGFDAAADLSAYNGGTVLCLGRNRGGHPRFQVWSNDNDLPSLVISTNFKASGDPKDYGLEILNPTDKTMRLAHRVPVGGNLQATKGMIKVL